MASRLAPPGSLSKGLLWYFAQALIAAWQNLPAAFCFLETHRLVG